MTSDSTVRRPRKSRALARWSCSPPSGRHGHGTRSKNSKPLPRPTSSPVGCSTSAGSSLAKRRDCIQILARARRSAPDVALADIELPIDTPLGVRRLRRQRTRAAIRSSSLLKGGRARRAASARSAPAPLCSPPRPARRPARRHALAMADELPPHPPSPSTATASSCATAGLDLGRRHRRNRHGARHDRGGSRPQHVARVARDWSLYPQAPGRPVGVQKPSAGAVRGQPSGVGTGRRNRRWNTSPAISAPRRWRTRRHERAPFRRAFVEETGETPARLRRAHPRRRRTRPVRGGAIGRAGRGQALRLCHVDNLRRAFVRRLGVTPQQYRQRFRLADNETRGGRRLNQRAAEKSVTSPDLPPHASGLRTVCRAMLLSPG